MASALGLVGAPGDATWERLGARLERRPSAELLVEWVRGATRPVTLAAIGPLTNVALASSSRVTPV